MGWGGVVGGRGGVRMNIVGVWRYDEDMVASAEDSPASASYIYIYYILTLIANPGMALMPLLGSCS